MSSVMQIYIFAYLMVYHPIVQSQLGADGYQSYIW